MTCHDLPWQNKATLSKMEELAEAAKRFFFDVGDAENG